MSLQEILQSLKGLKGDLIQVWIEYPFAKGLLTTDGNQLCTEKVTTTDGYEAVETVTLYKPKPDYKLEEIEFGLAAQIGSSGAAENVLYKWQVSDSGTLWEDLCAEQTYTTPGTTYVACNTMSGRFAPTGKFAGTGASFKVRFVIKSGSAGGETAKGKGENSSFIF